MNSFSAPDLANLAVPPRVLRQLTALAEYRGKQGLGAQTRPDVFKRLRQVAVIHQNAAKMAPRENNEGRYDHVPCTEYPLGIMRAAYRALDENTHHDLDPGARTRMVERAVEGRQ